MNFSRINIGSDAISFFRKEKYGSFEAANMALNNITGIVDFFEKESDV
jgi:hypothetical protein